jgi:hypothetical protein
MGDANGMNTQNKKEPNAEAIAKALEQFVNDLETISEKIKMEINQRKV